MISCRPVLVSGENGMDLPYATKKLSTLVCLLSHSAAGQRHTEELMSYIQQESGKAKVTLIPCQMKMNYFFAISHLN